MSFTPDTLINRDLPCRRCQYNLRTLAAGEICPECAMPILQSLVWEAPPRQRGKLTVERSLWAQFQVVAEFIAKRPQAIEFVLGLRAFSETRRRRRWSLFPRRVHVNAQDMWAHLANYVHHTMGPDTSTVAKLHDWGIRDGKDIGLIMYALNQAGMIIPSPTDRRDDFDYLGEVDALIPTREQGAAGDAGG